MTLPKPLVMSATSILDWLRDNVNRFQFVNEDRWFIDTGGKETLFSIPSTSEDICHAIRQAAAILKQQNGKK